jgi:IS30 family transposase
MIKKYMMIMKTDAINKLNNLPRKRHGFKTPAEMLAKEKFYLLGALRA